MTAMAMRVFGGIAPKVDPKLLPNHMGQVADNCQLFSGTLSAWRRVEEIVVLTKGALGPVKALFRMSDGVNDYWLNWLTDVNCVRGPIPGDTTQRIYYTGDGDPKMSNLALAISGAERPHAWFVLGVSPPTVAPTVGHTGGAAANETRAYVITFVTQFGEESQPSPAGSHTAPSDATWNLTNLQTAHPNAFTVTAGSWSGGVATLTVADTRGLRVGEEISVSGVTPSGYDVAKTTITALAATTISYPLASDPGAWSAGGTVTRLAPHNVTSMTKRIYRTLTGTAGAEFQFVAEIAVATTTYNDTIAGSALGEVLPSTDWAMPPVDMQGLIEFENGVLVGFSKNELCPCEPYRPHAWPSGYRQSTNRDIVGLGAFGKTIVVATKAQPWICFGTHPNNYTMERVNRTEPCLSKRGVASFSFGVIYPCPNGLMLVGEGGAVLTSEPILYRKQWDDYFPSTIHATEFQGRYFAWYTDEGGLSHGFIFDRGGQGPDLVKLSQMASASYTDEETGDLFIADGIHLKKWDANPLNFMPYDFRSKVFVNPKPINPGYAKLEAKYEELDDLDEEIAQAAEDLAFNLTILAGSETHPGQSKTKGEMNGAMWNEFMWNGSLLVGGLNPELDNRTIGFQLYARNLATNVMELKHTENPKSGAVFSLPSGYEATDFEFRVFGNIDAHSLEIAETAEELEGV